MGFWQAELKVACILEREFPANREIIREFLNSRSSSLLDILKLFRGKGMLVEVVENIANLKVITRSIAI